MSQPMSETVTVTTGGGLTVTVASSGTVTVDPSPPPPPPPPGPSTLGPGEWVPAHAPVTAMPGPYTFADDFGGPAGTPPDPAKWAHKVGPGAVVGGNNETETYVADTANAHQDGNGHLVIAVTNNGSGGFNSARLVTQGLFSQLYGSWEISLAIDNTAGCWPAAWFMGSNGGWPGCGELDLFESFGTGYSNGTAWSSTAATHISKNSAATLDTGFHVYRLDVTPTSVSMYRDNVLFNQVTNTQLTPWPFTGNPLYALLNVATGGNGTGNVNPNPANLPMCMIVDYVHVRA